MKIYAIIGQSQQTVIPDNMKYTPAEGEILMQQERPEGNYIAAEGGIWQEYDPPVEPTAEERIAALEAENEALEEAIMDLVAYIDSAE